MKNTILLFTLLTFIAFSSCQKNEKDFDKSEKDYDKEFADFQKNESQLDLCEWNEATEATGTAFEKYTVKPLVVNSDCNCVSEGMEKFLENGVTKFLIYYTAKDCEGVGYKVTCLNGDCDKGEKCKFVQNCEE